MQCALATSAGPPNRSCLRYNSCSVAYCMWWWWVGGGGRKASHVCLAACAVVWRERAADNETDSRVGSMQGHHAQQQTHQAAAQQRKAGTPNTHRPRYSSCSMASCRRKGKKGRDEESRVGSMHTPWCTLRNCAWPCTKASASRRQLQCHRRTAADHMCCMQHCRGISHHYTRASTCQGHSGPVLSPT